MSALPQLLTDARESGERLREVREEARARCVAAVRRLELSLVEALAGEKLRGLVEIAGAYRGARVRGRRPDEPIAPPTASRGSMDLVGKEVLVVNTFGNLVMVAAGARRDCTRARLADDSDLLIEDVEDFAAAAEHVLRRHVEALEKTASRFAACADLARRLEDVLRAAA